MDRLTARNKKGLAYLVNIQADEQEVNSPYKNTLQCILDCFERLALYEDIEQDGRLTKLFCKVGDTVYFADPVHPVATIDEVKLLKGKTEYWWVQYDTGPETCELWDKDYFTDDDIGKTVFLTYDEATAKIKEIN